MSLRMRRGGGSVVVPPPTEIYGPVIGAQTVRDNAKPNVIIDGDKPAGAINVSPGSNFTQALCNSSGAGAKFWLLAGTHNMTSGVQPLTNQQVWCQNGAVIDGGNLNFPFLIAGPNAGIQIHGGTWQRHGGIGVSDAALLLTGTQATGGWTVEDVTVINNFNGGIRLQAPNITLRRFKSNSNGRYGISGGGPNDGGLASGGLLEKGEITNNNTRDLSAGDDAGATKFTFQRSAVYRELWCHDNNGFGMWWDVSDQECQISDNVCENNLGSGIFYEISFGGTQITHNYVRGNGDGASANYPFNTVQIIISCSPCDGILGVLPGAAIRGEISYNDVDSVEAPYDSPIVLMTHSVHAYPKNTRNWYVHHNRMWIRGATSTSRTGLADACNTGAPKGGDIGTSPNAPGSCLFDYNEYHVADINGSYWEHDTAQLMQPGPRTFSGFQSRGHEAHGTVTVI